MKDRSADQSLTKVTALQGSRDWPVGCDDQVQQIHCAQYQKKQPKQARGVPLQSRPPYFLQNADQKCVEHLSVKHTTVAYIPLHLRIQQQQSS